MATKTTPLSFQMRKDPVVACSDSSSDSSDSSEDEEQRSPYSNTYAMAPPNERTLLDSNLREGTNETSVDSTTTNPVVGISTTPLGDWRVVLNVGGRRFETYARTFAKYPSTLLATIFLERNLPLLKADEKGEYFFDRNGDAFAAILDFYRTGVLVLPPSIPRKILKKEVDFFQLPKDCLYSSETPGERFAAMALASAKAKNHAELELLFGGVYSACAKAAEACCGTVKIDFLRNASYMRTSSGIDSCQCWQWNVNVIDKTIVKFLSDKSNISLFSNILKSKGFRFELSPLSRASFGLQIALWEETKRLMC